VTSSSPTPMGCKYHQDSEATIHCQINLKLYTSYIYLSSLTTLTSVMWL
uniref:Uncharacterized protein n=1 Tax=Panthera leo TaxID=9689 RepID=A0A8C8WF95_PANLE